MKIFIFFLCVLYSANLFAIPVSATKISDVTFTRLNFVYMEAQGTIEDNFEAEINMINNYILQYGIVTKQNVILFLDFFGTDEFYEKTYENNEKDYAEARISKGIVVSKDLKFDVTEKYLKDNFGTSYLNINRKVLVGVLLFPNTSIAPTGEIKTIKFSTMVLPVYQAVLPTDEDTVTYSAYDRIYDRTSMLKYMNLSPSKYIGMMEIYDNENKAITFAGLTGNKEEFIQSNSIRGLIPGLSDSAN